MVFELMVAQKIIEVLHICSEVWAISDILVTVVSLF